MNPKEESVVEDNYVYGVARRSVGASFRGPVIGCSSTRIRIWP